MRIVDDDQRRIGDPLHASGDRRQVGDQRHRFLRPEAEGEQAAEHAERVGDVEAADLARMLRRKQAGRQIFVDRGRR